MLVPPSGFESTEIVPFTSRTRNRCSARFRSVMSWASLQKPTSLPVESLIGEIVRETASFFPVFVILQTLVNFDRGLCEQEQATADQDEIASGDGAPQYIKKTGLSA